MTTRVLADPKRPETESTQLALGFLEALADDDTLTSRQTVSLQHVGRLEGLEVVDGLTESRLIKGTVSRCGDTVALHERLAKVPYFPRAALPWHRAPQ